MERARSANPVILWGNPYGFLDRDRSSNGVNNLVQEGKPYIESKGFEIIFVAPKVGDNSNNVADHNLGKAVNVPKCLTKVTGTSLPISLPFDKRKARNLILEIEPTFLFLEEPTASLGFFAHGLISGMPRREDGKPVSVVGARFHAGIYDERAEALYRFLVYIGKELKRPRFTKHGFPNGKLTVGVLHTLLNNLDFRIAVSRTTAEAFEKRFGDNFKEYKIIHNGINTDELTPEGTRIEEWKKDGKDIVLCVAGRHDLRKGIEYAIEAFSIIRRERPNTKLIIAGEGPETSYLKALVVAKGLSDDVKFVGQLSRDDYVEALRTADVCICPAIGGEGFGRVVVEPLACGTPVVLSDIDGYREAADGGRPFALMAEPRKPVDIAEKTITILNRSPDIREQLQWDAALYVRERFAWPIIAAQIAEVLNDAYNSHGGVDWSRSER